MQNIIWIDENVDSYLNLSYSQELKSINSVNVNLFKNVIEAINYLKTLRFEDTKIIICGRLYSEFVNTFKKNIIEMYVIPKIIVFTRNKEKFIEFNPDYYDSNNKFYNFGGIAIVFDEIKKFLNNEGVYLMKKISSISTLKSDALSLVNKIESKMIDKSKDIKLTFEYIDSKQKLIFPLFFKIFIEHASNNDLDKYNKYLYDKFSKENSALNELLEQIKSIHNIPIEILSKYYARIYTNFCKFHSILNEDLRLNKKSKHIPFIKTLYEGVKLKSLLPCKSKQLYRGAQLSDEEINKINLYLKKKIDYLPGSIVFSKSFLSFTKDKDVAKNFLKNYPKHKDFSKVIFILENDDNDAFNLATHGDIENISFFPLEKEVLFFPFSSFEIKEIKPK